MPQRTLLAIGLIALVGIALRIAVMGLGSNFDLASYEIVGELQSEGKNVYAWTGRYNYGPIWFILLGWFWDISTAVVGGPGLFRILVVALLTMADLGIGYILMRRFGPRAAAFFILSPISIVITGFHNQFDMLAILLGLIAVLILGEERDGPITVKQVAGLALLAVSITTKHLLFFLPLWLAMGQAGWRRRTVFGALPIVLFGASFLPWIYEGWWGIVDNVISYRSVQNAPLVNALTFGQLGESTLAAAGSVVFFAGMVGLGWMVRRLTPFTALLVMIVGLVVLAPGVANQVLAIPVAAIAATPNVWFALYTIGGSVLLIGDSDGFGYDTVVLPMFDRDVVGRAHIYDVLILMLAAGGLQWWRQERTTSSRRAREVDHALA